MSIFSSAAMVFAASLPFRCNVVASLMLACCPISSRLAIRSLLTVWCFFHQRYKQSHLLYSFTLLRSFLDSIPSLTLADNTASCMNVSDISNSRCPLSRIKNRNRARGSDDSRSHDQPVRAVVAAKKQSPAIAPTVDWLNLPAPLAHLVAEDIADHSSSRMRATGTAHRYC